MGSQHLIQNILLSDDQWGFSPENSTVTALILSFHNILKSLDDVGLVFFDLRKAFDSVPNLPLVQRLWELDLNCHILQWITNFLYCRRQYVVVNGVCSPITPVMSVLPQGSILGPLLFITYINPVSDLSLSCEAKLTINADDNLLYKPIISVDDFSALKSDIDQISNCIRSLHLGMNPSKCKYLIASKKDVQLTHPCSYY